MIQNNDASIPKPSPLTALAKIASLLNLAELSGPDLLASLEILGTALGARTAGIYRKWHGDSDGISLKCLGSWFADSTATGRRPDCLRFEDVPQPVWNKLDAHEFACLAAPGPHPSRDGFPLWVGPLFLKDHLFGFVYVGGIRQAEPSADQKDFLAAACNVLELWVSKLNTAKRLADLIEFLPNATIGIDHRGIATVWNPAVEKMTGWKAQRIIGKGDYEYALPFYDMRRPLICNLVLQPDPKWEATYPEFRKEGDVVHSLIFTPALTGGGAFLTGSTKRMRDLTGFADGSMHIVRDITRERQIESQLQSSESMFRTITDYAGLGIALFQKEKALYYNERFEELLGISGREITLQDLINTVYSEDRQEISFHLDQMFEGTEKKPLRLDLRAQPADNLRDYSSYAQVLDYEGKLTVCFVLDDITEQKKLARRARMNELKLYHEGRLTSLGIMAAGIAHELNQPLNTIRVITDGFLFGRQKEWELDPDELYESLEMISRQVLRMSEVIQNIRNFAREDRDQTCMDVNVNEAVNNVFSMIGRQLEAHNIRVQKVLPKNLPTIKTDINRLEQVIMNLVVNARQALDTCRHDSRTLWVKTGTRNECVYIEVGDNATGISEDLIGRIFDPFFTTKDVGQGTGLGLTISQSIVSEFKGRIDAFNNDSGGATFIVSASGPGGRL